MSIPRSLTRMPIQARSFASSAYNAQKASHAYHIPPTPGAGPSRLPPPPPRTRATSEKPILTAEEQQVIDRIVRVDQAGELGANWIYRGQKMGMSIRGDRKAVKQIDVCLRSILPFVLFSIVIVIHLSYSRSRYMRKWTDDRKCGRAKSII